MFSVSLICIKFTPSMPSFIIDWPISPRPSALVDSILILLIIDILFMSLSKVLFKSLMPGKSDLDGVSGCFYSTVVFVGRADFCLAILYGESSGASGLNEALVEVFSGYWSANS